MACLASVVTPLLSWSIIFKWEILACGVVAGNAVFVNCTDDMTITFIYSIFQASTGFSYELNVAVFFCYSLQGTR